MHWLTIIGIALVAVGTIFSLLGQNINSKNKNETLLHKIDNYQKDIGLKDEKIGSLVNKIDNYQDDIELKNKKIENLEKNAQKMNYKTLDESIKKVVIKELTGIKKVSEIKFKDVDFKIDFGTIDRVKNTSYVIRDLRGIFTEAGYNVSKPSNAMVINNNLKIYKYPVIIVNPKYEELAINITLSLNKFLTNLKYVTDSNNKYATLIFQFYGIPEFSEDGSVKYQ